MTNPKPKRAARPNARVMNPHTPHLRASTVPNKKRVASKAACRGRVQI